MKIHYCYILLSRFFRIFKSILTTSFISLALGKPTLGLEGVLRYFLQTSQLSKNSIINFFFLFSFFLPAGWIRLVQSFIAFLWAKYLCNFRTSFFSSSLSDLTSSSEWNNSQTQGLTSIWQSFEFSFQCCCLFPPC